TTIHANCESEARAARRKPCPPIWRSAPKRESCSSRGLPDQQRHREARQQRGHFDFASIERLTRELILPSSGGDFENSSVPVRGRDAQARNGDYNILAAPIRDDCAGFRAGGPERGVRSVRAERILVGVARAQGLANHPELGQSFGGAHQNLVV